MKTLHRFSGVIAFAILCLGLTLDVQSALAQDYQVIHNFTGAEGAFPGSLTMDSSGNIYGTSAGGGLGDDGTVFEMSPSQSGWGLTTLYEFTGGTDGSNPVAKVIFGPDGGLYGMTEYGGGGSCNSGGKLGCGTVFELKPSAIPCSPCQWTETVLYRFAGGADGALPLAEPIFDNAGNIFGTTSGGGCEAGCGTVFELTPSSHGWTETQIHTFGNGNDDGLEPATALTFDTYGKLYGTTLYGEAKKSLGTAFQLTLSAGGWTESVIYQFSFIGGHPRSVLLLDSTGNLYGALSLAGANGSASIFELTPSGGSWNATVLHYFDAATTIGPVADISMDNSGNIYGTTYGGASSCTPEACGTIFELARSGGGWTYTQLYDFPGGSDGQWPTSNVVIDASGNLFGTASAGGTDNLGVVFEAQPVATLFSDLGPITGRYSCCEGWTIAGSGGLGVSFTAADLFTVAGSGNFDITQIDLGVNYISGDNLIYASILTNDGGVPGSQVANAYWGNLAGVVRCCNLITIPVSGVTLTGGQSYFMVVGPMNLSSSTFEAWNWNIIGISGLGLYSNDGGNTWTTEGTLQPPGAFDVLGTRQ